MEWIKTILPLIGVALGWLRSERGKIFADKRQDKRKLKKLLFFLLELRYHFARELSKNLKDRLQCRKDFLDFIFTIIDCRRL